MTEEIENLDEKNELKIKIINAKIKRIEKVIEKIEDWIQIYLYIF